MCCGKWKLSVRKMYIPLRAEKSIFTFPGRKVQSLSKILNACFHIVTF